MRLKLAEETKKHLFPCEKGLSVSMSKLEGKTEPKQGEFRIQTYYPDSEMTETRAKNENNEHRKE